VKYVRPGDLVIAFQNEPSLLISTRAFAAAARTPTFAAEILAFCGEARTEQDVAGRYGADGARLFKHLVDARLLVTPAEADATPAFFMNFSALDVHRKMLADRVRLEAYAAAIREVVRPGMTVADAGTGSGVLATLAAHAGASTVFAIDHADVLDHARAVFRASGVEDRVKPVRGDFRSLSLECRVDVVLTETFGAFGLAEGGPNDIVGCCAQNLAPGGRVIPEEMVLWLAPVGRRELLEAAIGPFEPWTGVNLSPLRDAAMHRALTADIGVDALAALPRALHRFRLGEAPYGEGRVHWEDIAGDEIVGFAGWFDLHLTPSVTLSTGPHAPQTHWRQQFFPLDSLSTRGHPLKVSMSIQPADDDRRALNVALTWASGAQAGETWYRVR
jgi:SAM-dependent methyltransferase